MIRAIGLFVEDAGHEAVVQALVKRLAQEANIPITLSPHSVRGGHGRMQAELKQFVRDWRRGHIQRFDLLIIGRDANCEGIHTRRRELEEIAGVYGSVVYAIPDPHIERWLLLDSAAFKQVLGRGCQAPDQKCERKRYKLRLNEAIRQAGLSPVLGGLEHAEALIKHMDLARMEQIDPSLGRFLQDVRTIFQQWGAH